MDESKLWQEVQIGCRQTSLKMTTSKGENSDSERHMGECVKI